MDKREFFTTVQLVSLVPLTIWFWDALLYALEAAAW